MIPDYVTRLRAEIERREQSKRYCDAAEGQRLLRRQDNERSLDNAYGRLEAALCPPEQVVGELGGVGCRIERRSMRHRRATDLRPR
jgi:hypothetical protein